MQLQKVVSYNFGLYILLLIISAHMCPQYMFMFTIRACDMSWLKNELLT